MTQCRTLLLDGATYIVPREKKYTKLLQYKIVSIHMFNCYKVMINENAVNLNYLKYQMKSFSSSTYIHEHDNLSQIKVHFHCKSP